MDDFKSFNKGQKEDGSKQQVSADQTANITTMLAKAMSGKSEGQIWSMILAQAEQGKKDGTLTNADLDNFYNAVAPMVDGFKRQKLKSVINKLKQI